MTSIGHPSDVRRATNDGCSVRDGATTVFVWHRVDKTRSIPLAVLSCFGAPGSQCLSHCGRRGAGL